MLANNANFLQASIWSSLLSDKMTLAEIAIAYITQQVDFQYVTLNSNDYSESARSCMVDKVSNALLSFSPWDMRSLIRRADQLAAIASNNIPQFSSFPTAAVCVPDQLMPRTAPISWVDLGYALFPSSVSDGAAIKYGENHGKMAALLDLALPVKEKGKGAFLPTVFTPFYCNLPQTDKMNLLVKLCFRIPIVQQAVIADDPYTKIDQLLHQYLAESTYLRRRSNVLEVLHFALEE